MRIRKRFPPPSINLSDPHLHNSTPLLLMQQPKPDSSQPPAPSDPPNQLQPLIKQENKKMDRFDEIKINDSWKEGIQCAGATSEVVVLSSSSSRQVFGGWFGEDRAIPIKKRRGSLGKRANAESLVMKEEEERRMAKMKSKTNKKCALNQENGGNVEHEARKETSSKEGIDLNVVASSDVNKKNIVKRGSVIMEGSRCSRVNGRGWRCCQQTLVGYSLCEHHLGKGRLRSMNSVRNRAKSKKGSTEIDRVKPERLQKKKHEIVLLNHDDDNEEDDNDYDEEDDTDYEDDDDDDDDDELVMKNKKKKKKKERKKKIGMVKARSMSSLLGLGQRESEVIMVDENDKEEKS